LGWQYTSPLGSQQLLRNIKNDNRFQGSTMNNSLLKSSVNNFVDEFTASKQSELFETIRQLRFSGQLVLTGLMGQKWIFHLHLGHLIYATGGTHPVKRWHRNLTTYMPQIDSEPSTWQDELAGIAAENFNICWQYQLLCAWVEQQKIAREQAVRTIWSTLVEVLFDVTQAKGVTYELKQEQLLSAKLVLIDAQQAIAETDRQWQVWKAAKFAQYSLNKAPTVKNSDQLQQSTSAHIYQTLSQLLNGQQTLRDLTVQMKRDALTVTRSFLPYIQSGLVELVHIPDLPSPVFHAPMPAELHTPLIACVDDSPMICEVMKQIVTASGYRFVGINDPLRAIGALLALKPDLIFLDLMMPHTNGYELCEKLRKLAVFRSTPILILTGNDGIIDRVRAKMVGSTDFLSKAAVDAERVMGAVCKHLRHCTFPKMATERFLLPASESQKAA
jgi:chemotaxis family two-component system response regulator PixG